jgi:general secretion pathway protein A
VLVGQPELDELLGRHELRQVKQRIAMRTVIGGFTAKESMAYIAHRLGVAGAETESIFKRAALRKIAKESKGVPRIINILCDNALSAARRYDLKMVTGKVVKEVTAEFNGQERRHHPGWGLAVSVLAFCLIALFFLIFRYGRFGSPVAQKSPDKAVRVASAPSISLTDPGRAMPQADPGATKDEAIIKQTSPPAAPKQTDAQAKTGQAQTKIIAKRTVEWGDSLSKLTEEVYGRSSDEVLKHVKDNNSHIKDINNLRMGSVVSFPELPKNLSARGRVSMSAR